MRRVAMVIPSNCRSPKIRFRAIRFPDTFLVCGFAARFGLYILLNLVSLFSAVTVPERACPARIALISAFTGHPSH
ncbi:hypothetical protein ACLKA7_017699 [Drosophila subpalustris]